MQRTTIFAFLTAASLFACYVDNDPDSEGSSGVGTGSGSGGTTSGPSSSSMATTGSDSSSTSTDSATTSTGSSMTSGCGALCAAAGPLHLGCVEGSFEELGFQFDGPGCDEYENSVGFPGACVYFAQCQNAEMFSDAECDMVATVCL